MSKPETEAETEMTPDSPPELTDKDLDDASGGWGGSSGAGVPPPPPPVG